MYIYVKMYRLNQLLSGKSLFDSWKLINDVILEEEEKIEKR